VNVAGAITASGGRRFLLAVSGGLVSTALLVFDYIGESSFVTLQLGLVGAYITGNVIQKYNAVKYKSDDDITR